MTYPSAGGYVFEHSCPNPWHDYHYGKKQPGTRQFLTCPECPPERHYELARLARRGAAMVVVDIDIRDNPQKYASRKPKYELVRELLDSDKPTREGEPCG